MHRWQAEICAVILPKFELKRSATSGKLRPYVFFFSPKELLRFGWFLRSYNGKHNSNSANVTRVDNRKGSPNAEDKVRRSLSSFGRCLFA